MFFWQDIVEISFFSILFYQLLLWLSKNKSKPLLLYFLTYSLFFILSYFFSFHSITAFFISYTPVIIMLFILMHEKTLQRNFVTSTPQTLKQSNLSHWIDTIIRVALQSAHHKKKVTYVIEQQNDISTYLSYPFLIDTNIQEELLTTLIQSNTYQKERMIWINNEGILKSINCTWKEKESTEDFITLLTLSTDVIIVTIDAHNALFSLTTKGSISQHIKPEQIIYLLKKETKTKYINRSNNNETTKNTSAHL